MLNLCIMCDFRSKMEFGDTRELLNNQCTQREQCFSCCTLRVQQLLNRTILQTRNTIIKQTFSQTLT